MTWGDPTPIADFLRSLGASKMNLIRSPKTGKRFFAVPGTKVTGAVSDKVDDLTLDLQVSEVTPVDGEPFYFVTKPSDNNVESSLSID